MDIRIMHDNRYIPIFDILIQRYLYRYCITGLVYHDMVIYRYIVTSLKAIHYLIQQLLATYTHKLQKEGDGGICRKCPILDPPLRIYSSCI